MTTQIANKIHPDMARDEMKRWAEACGIDLTVTDKEDREFMDRIVQYIADGWLVIDEDGRGIYELRHPTTKPIDRVVFTEPNGRIMKELDKMGESKYQTGLLAFLAAFAGTTQANMSNVMKRDLDVLKDIAMLFLG